MARLHVSRLVAVLAGATALVACAGLLGACAARAPARWRAPAPSRAARPPRRRRPIRRRSPSRRAVRAPRRPRCRRPRPSRFSPPLSPAPVPAASSRRTRSACSGRGTATWWRSPTDCGSRSTILWSRRRHGRRRGTPAGTAPATPSGATAPRSPSTRRPARSGSCGPGRASEQALVGMVGTLTCTDPLSEAECATLTATIDDGPDVSAIDLEAIAGPGDEPISPPPTDTPSSSGDG